MKTFLTGQRLLALAALCLSALCLSSPSLAAPTVSLSVISHTLTAQRGLFVRISGVSL